MKLTRRIITLVLAMVLLVSSFSITAFAKSDIMYGIGFTTGSNLRLRSQPSSSGKILATAPKGEVVVVAEKVGDWYKVIYNLKEGYMHSDYVSVLTKENAELGYGKINGSRVNLRSGPSTSYKAVVQGSKGDQVYIVGINTGWYKVIYGGRICYIRSDYVTLTEIPYENNASTKSPIFFRGGKSTGVAVSAAALNGGSASGTTTSTLGSKIVAEAKKYLGVSYVYGGATPSGFDCSGLVYYVLKSLGYSPYRSSKDQYKMGTYVDKDDLQPGDLVFFANTYKAGISHVGIYVGNGQFIHSPSSGKTVCYESLDTTYYVNHYYGARRLG